MADFNESEIEVEESNSRENENAFGDNESRGCEPIFVINNQLPAFDEKNFTTAEICAAAEKVTGYDSVVGAQRIGGLWRIYPKNRDVRQQLLVQGIILRSVSVSFLARNPFMVQVPRSYRSSGRSWRQGAQVPTTRLIISNMPLSFSDTEIQQALNHINVVFCSKLIQEYDRDANGKMTHWKTGRRFAYIILPTEPLQKTLKIGTFTAALYHKEQKTLDRQREAECKRCLTKGHRTDTCTAPIKCRQCFKDGHKAGDTVCQMAPSDLSNPNGINNVNVNDNNDENVDESSSDESRMDERENDGDDEDDEIDDDNHDDHSATVDIGQKDNSVETITVSTESENQNDKGKVTQSEIPAGPGAIPKKIQPKDKKDRGRTKNKEKENLIPGQSKLTFRREGSGSVKRKGNVLEEDDNGEKEPKLQKLHGKGKNDNKSSGTTSKESNPSKGDKHDGKSGLSDGTLSSQSGQATGIS